MSQEETAPPSAPLPLQSFSLSTLLLAMTFCSVWLAVVMASPVVGFGSLFVLIPASVRTVVGVNIRKKAGYETPTGVKLQLFIVSCLYSLTAISLFLFLFLVTAMLVFIIANFLQEWIRDLPNARDHLFVAACLGLIFAFVLSWVPPIYILAQEWPRGFDPGEGKLLNKMEMKARAAIMEKLRKNSVSRRSAVLSEASSVAESISDR